MRQVILNIHGIGDPAKAPRTLEPGEADYWISPDVWLDAVDRAAYAMAHGSTRVHFTFDDGNASDLIFGAPALESYGITATFFPLSGRLNKEGSLSSENLRELVSRGHRIGNHGQDHIDWTGANLVVELETARKVIEAAAGMSVSKAAIPFGRYNRRVLRALRFAGYTACYSSDGGMFHDGDWPIARNSLKSNTHDDRIQELIEGRETLSQRFRRPFGRLRKRLI